MRSFLSALSSVPADRALDELRRRAWIVGTPDQARSQLEAWAALGIERVMFQWYNLDDLDGLALLAQLQGAPEAQSSGKRGRDESSV
jgi:alkanesulfonate monooxygenase SsuD/methylene tetrahydromethanopterin reductase-like flavin-dependent oxidoreductase (luciferase family)